MIQVIPKREAGVVYTKPWMVELILDLAGYTVEQPLGQRVAVEPSAGDGAFLQEMVRRLIGATRRHQQALDSIHEALCAYEIDPVSAAQARGLVRYTLAELGLSEALANSLAQAWIKTADFLEASVGMPCADYVVGNPPYVRLEDIPAAKAAFYRSYSAMRGRADLYVAFYQAALLQLRPGGVCAFICADRWMLNDYGSALRAFVTGEGYAVRTVIEAHTVDAFDSEVSAYPAVTVIARAPQSAVVVAKALPGIESAPTAEILEHLRRATSAPYLRASRFESWFQGEEPWPCASPEALRVLQDLEARCLPLESMQTGTKIGIGVATGADKVFITDPHESINIESDRLLPLAFPADLRAGRVAWSGRHLINPWDASGLVDLAAYPRLTARLRPHEPLLRGRHTAKERPHQWHKTIDRVNLPLFKRPKLYIADIKDRLLPALDEGHTYPHHNLYWITSETWDLRVLGALLMSCVGEFFIHCYAVRMRGGHLRFQAQYLRRIRVPHPETITPALAARLRQAFDEQDFASASAAALEAYGLDAPPPLDV